MKDFIAIFLLCMFIYLLGAFMGYHIGKKYTLINYTVEKNV